MPRLVHPRARRALASVALIALVASIAPAGAAPAPGAYRDLDQSVTALNILPPGQGRYLNAAELALAQSAGIQPSSNTDQLDLYEDLVAAAPGLTDSDLPNLFKDGSFGAKPEDITREYSPRDDVTVVRDTFDVPHVYGSTRAGTMFGAGYVSGEDRMFMMDLLRHLARGRMSEFLGASEANLASDRAIRLAADYTEEELWHMALRLIDVDGELAYLALQDLNNYVAGINAFMQEMLVDSTKRAAEYEALQIVPKAWKLTDTVAIATLIGGQFSVGGGGQLENATFLHDLEQEHDAATARAIFDELRLADDPEAPVTTSERFEYNADTGPIDPRSVAMPDDPHAVLKAYSEAELPTHIDGPFGPIQIRDNDGMSNALLVSADASATGRPLAVFGPQVSYYSPQILMEIDMHGPGVHARGAAFPGISLYILLGRGTDYAWSATTAYADHIDVRAERLCEPDGSAPTIKSVHYMADGTCTEMYRRTDTWLAKPGAGGTPAAGLDGDEVVVTMTTERTHLGIVIARATVDGDPVAYVRQRSSYMKEVDATLSFTAIHDPARVSSMEDLLHAFGDYFTFAFNWHFVDSESIGYITTGLYPTMAPGADQDLPFWGDSEWDWTGWLTYDEHSQAIDPPEGFITNWNNKQAPGWRTPDTRWSFGPVHRKQLLHDGVVAALPGGVTMTELVQAMGLAATQDLRGVKVLPLILDVIGTPSDPELAAAAARLSDWVDDGAHRRDIDGDRVYEDDDAVRLMDALWSPALDAMFRGTLGAAFDTLPETHSGQPGPGGSSFGGGWYSQVHKDLRSVLGVPVDGAFGRTYCGGGSLTDCRDALLGALQAAVDAAPALSDRWASDAIRFSAVGIQGQRAMHWQNRPTWQQVVEFAD